MIRTIAWVSHYDLSGYTRMHRVEVSDANADLSIHNLYHTGKVERTKCGITIPQSVVDLTEHTMTLRCNRCFKEDRK